MPGLEPLRGHPEGRSGVLPERSSWRRRPSFSFRSPLFLLGLEFHEFHGSGPAVRLAGDGAHPPRGAGHFLRVPGHSRRGFPHRFAGPGLSCHYFRVGAQPRVSSPCGLAAYWKVRVFRCSSPVSFAIVSPGVRPGSLSSSPLLFGGLWRLWVAAGGLVIAAASLRLALGAPGGRQPQRWPCSGFSGHGSVFFGSFPVMLRRRVCPAVGRVRAPAFRPALGEEAAWAHLVGGERPVRPAGLSAGYRAYLAPMISAASRAAFTLSFSWSSTVVIRVAFDQRSTIAE